MTLQRDAVVIKLFEGFSTSKCNDSCIHNIACVLMLLGVFATSDSMLGVILRHIWTREEELRIDNLSLSFLSFISAKTPIKRFRVAFSSFEGLVIGNPFLCYRQASEKNGGLEPSLLKPPSPNDDGAWNMEFPNPGFEPPCQKLACASMPDSFPGPFSITAPSQLDKADQSEPKLQTKPKRGTGVSSVRL